jgi:uncharacterized membrane protein (UPF0127 family)
MLPHCGTVKRRFLALFLAALAGLAGGCKPAASDPLLPTEVQPRLATIKIYLGPREITAEVARTEWQQRCGMMFRTNIGENEGMIFLLPQPMQASFWMKNCPQPLSAAYIDPQGTIEEIHPLQPQDTNPVVATSGNIQYVLETAQGWFERNGITTGAVITTEKGSLGQTFWGKQ